MELSEQTEINNHIIKLKKDKHLLFDQIYSLRSIKLETLKTYIETNLANNFIWPSKFFIRVPIFFDQKSDRNFRFYIDYWTFNNLIIEN